MHKKFLLLIWFVGISLSAAAEDWKYIGPDGGEVYQLEQDSRNPALWFALVGKQNRLYQSFDFGRSWNKSSQTDVTSFSIHPKTSEIFIVKNIERFRSDLCEILVSSDHGKNFRVLAKFLTQVDLTVDPVNSNRMLLSISDSNGLYITHNAGVSWKSVRSKPFQSGNNYPGWPGCGVEEMWFQEFSIMPFDTNIIYGRGRILLSCPPRGEETTEAFLMRSRNGGFDWTFVKDGYYRFHSDPMFPDRTFIYRVDSPAKLYQVTRNGMTALSNTQINFITEISNNPNQLLAYGENGFKRSNDGGRNWKNITLDPLQQKVTQLNSSHSADQGILVATSEGGIFRTTDLLHWSRSNVGITETGISQLEVNNSSDVIYAVTGDRCVRCSGSGSFLYRMSDNESSWKSLVTQLPDHTEIRSLAVHTLDGNRLLAVAKDDHFGTYLTSFDGGLRWKSYRLDETGRNIESATWHPVNKEIAYLLDNSGLFTIWKTTDAGKTLSKIEVPQIQYGYDVRLVFDPQNADSFYLLHKDGVLHSVDGGQTFQKLNTSMRWPVDMVALPQPSSFLLLTLWGEIHRTDDGGNTWKKISKIGRWCQHIYSAQPSGKHFFVTRMVPSTEINHLLESNDGGISWKDVSSDVDPTGVFDIAVLGNSIFAGTNHGVRLRQ